MASELDPLLLVIVQERIAKAVSRLRRRIPLTREDRLDLEAEVLASLYARLAQYDPARAGRQAFARMLIQRAIVSLLRKRFARNRDVTRQCTLPTPDLVDHSQDQAHRDLPLDLESLLSRVGEADQVLARHLMRHSVAETARLLGLPRSTLQRHLQRLRRHCEDHGLDIYL